MLAPARIALLFTIVSWASAFPLIRIGLEGYTPAELALLRYGVAALVFAAYAIARRVRLPPLGDALRIAGLGMLGIALYGVLLGYGERALPAGTASLLISSSPVWMVALAAAFSGERPSRAALLSVGISFLGAALIAVGDGVGGFDLHAVAVIGSAIAGATYSVFLRPYTARYGAVRVTLVAVWGATLALLPGGPGLVDAVRAAPAASTWAVLFLGVVPGALGYVAWAYASARASAATAGVALYLVPVVAMVPSNWMLGEVPSVVALAGGALVLAGVASLQRPSAERRRASSSPPALGGAAWRSAQLKQMD